MIDLKHKSRAERNSRHVYFASILKTLISIPTNLPASTINRHCPTKIEKYSQACSLLDVLQVMLLSTLASPNSVDFASLSLVKILLISASIEMKPWFWNRKMSFVAISWAII
ncbi:hypothetical protein LIPSTDRAFT_201186 [Lipomyces starkeyi NRRL Y-11557]|uniref:Uncharacterized protein n=1 Tax=Lipomyces starkeyi NRRL Y-11557 TaxID=675824 RepID=A0A1E3PUP8_LIPST|nr:hypothetical protein LIPSTDRAFT_201186 [Lipomyces starkeyi NRRL Y-11557]